MMKADKEGKYYLYVLDFEDGRAYRYHSENQNFGESPEDFLKKAGHNIFQCEYMVTNNKYLEYGN
mgnify:CR=1 FL=1